MDDGKNEKSARDLLREKHAREKSDPEYNGPLAPAVRAVEVAAEAAGRAVEGVVETTDEVLDELFDW